MYFNIIQEELYKLKNYKKSIVDVGLLWNALTEAGEKKILDSLSKESDPLLIQADSGGLQLMRKGQSSDIKVKEAIYSRQLHYSNQAMSFDEMPIRIDESKDNSNVLDNENKYFILDLLYQSGYDSGLNLIEQCKSFNVGNGKAKIMAILQGSTIEDYNEYARGLFEPFLALDEDTRSTYYNYIEGISFGMTGCNTYFKLLDLYCRFNRDLTNVPINLRNTVHFLGVGGSTKISFLYALNEDFYGKDINISFDSTSRTRSSTFGKLTKLTKKKNVIKQKTLSLGRNRSSLTDHHLEDMYNLFSDSYKILGITDITDIIESSPWKSDGLRTSKQLLEEYGELKGREIYINSILIHDFFHWLKETYIFIDILDEFSKKNFTLFNNNNKIKKALLALDNINDYEDYMKYRNFFFLALDSKYINNINFLNNLDEFNNIKLDTMSLDEW